MTRFISEANIKELLIGLDSLPWEEEIDDIIKPLIETDVKKVVRGEWLGEIECSECGQIDWTAPNFCPNCGADMRGDKE